MALTYAQLIADRKTDGSIKNWLNNDSLPVQTIVYEAQRDLYARLRCREMVALYEGAMVAAQDYIDITTAVPRYRQPLAMKLYGAWTGNIQHTTPVRLEDERVYDSSTLLLVEGQPTLYTVRGSRIVWDFLPDDAYTFRWLYYGALADLDADSNTTNFLLDRCFPAFKAACLMHAAEWQKKDSDRTYWAQVLTAHITAFNQEADAELGQDSDMRVEAV